MKHLKHFPKHFPKYFPKWFPKYTAFLIVLTTLIYFIFSSYLLYVPTKILIALGFAFFNPEGILTYTFMHIGPTHLLGNMLLLLPVGIIAEKKLTWQDYFTIYLLSGAVAAIIFSALAPETILVGASAAISGLIAASFMVDFKKAFVLILVFSFLITLVAPAVTAFTKQQLENLQEKSLELTDELEQTEDQIRVAIEENKTGLVLNLTKKKNQTTKQLAKIIEEQTSLDIGLEREKESQTSPIVHLAGAMCGMIYLFIRRRDIIWEMPYQLIPRKYWSKK